MKNEEMVTREMMDAAHAIEELAEEMYELLEQMKNREENKMTKLKQVHAYDNGEIYKEIEGAGFYLAVRFLDDADVSVFRWLGENAPTASDSLVKFTRGWDFFTTFEMACTDEGEIDWEAYEIDLEDAIEI